MREKQLLLRDGAKLYYEDLGEEKEKALIMLHGNGEQGSIFAPMAVAFGSEYTVIMPDSRGHGRSERGSLPLNFDTMADDLLELINAEKREKVSLIGFSDGASIAISFALRYPERLDSLVLIGANISPSGVKKQFQLPIVIGYGICKFFGVFSKKAALNAETIGLMVKYPHFAPEQLAKIDLPALLIYGDKDMMTSGHIELIKAAFSRSELCMIKGADHFVFSKKPQEVNEQIKKFLEAQNLS